MSNSLLSAAHLYKELGGLRIGALLADKNIRKVLDFAVGLYNGRHATGLDAEKVIIRDLLDGASLSALQAIANLEWRIGLDLFSALASSDNTRTVREFATDLVMSELPSSFTVGGRTYELIVAMHGINSDIWGIEHFAAVEKNSGFSQDDGEYILQYQDELPAEYRRKLILVFPYWTSKEGERASLVSWANVGGGWHQMFWLQQCSFSCEDAVPCLLRRVSEGGAR